MRVEVSVFEFDKGNPDRVDGFIVPMPDTWVRSLAEGDWLIFNRAQWPPSVGASFEGTREGDQTTYELKRRIMEFNERVDPSVLLHVQRAKTT